MARKILESYVFHFPSAFARNATVRDIETFSGLPDGEMRINILTGTCRHSQLGNLDTDIAGILKNWFASRVQRLKIPIEVIECAELAVTVNDLFRPTKSNLDYLDDWAGHSALRRLDGGTSTATDC